MSHLSPLPVLSLPDFPALSSFYSGGADAPVVVLRHLRAVADVLSRSDRLFAGHVQSLLGRASDFPHALALVLAQGGAEGTSLSAAELESLFLDVYHRDESIVGDALADLAAIIRNDPAAQEMLTPFLFFKGFHALQIHRVAHVLWKDGRKGAALMLQSRSSRMFGVDIHPAARIGRGVVFDHATGIVIGETAVIEDGVQLFHNVTLGGTGKDREDRHPKIRRGALVGAGAIVLGNIEIGAGARVGAGSVVLRPVPAGATVVGVWAQSNKSSE